MTGETCCAAWPRPRWPWDPSSTRATYTGFALVLALVGIGSVADSEVASGVSLLACAVVVWLGLSNRRVSALRIARSYARDPSMGAPATYVLDPSGLHIRYDDYESRLPWSHFAVVRDLKGDLVLAGIGGMRLLLLPHEAFAGPDEVASARGWIGYWLTNATAEGGEVHPGPVDQGDAELTLPVEERRAAYVQRWADACLEVQPEWRRRVGLVALAAAAAVIAVFAIAAGSVVPGVVLGICVAVVWFRCGRRRTVVRQWATILGRDPSVGVATTWLLGPSDVRRYTADGAVYQAAWTRYTSAREHDGSLLLVPAGALRAEILPPWAFTDGAHRHQVTESVTTWITAAHAPATE